MMLFGLLSGNKPQLPHSTSTNSNVKINRIPHNDVLHPTTLFTGYINIVKVECGPMPKVMVALPNIGGALCSTPQSLADAHYLTAVQ